MQGGTDYRSGGRSDENCQNECFVAKQEDEQNLRTDENINGEQQPEQGPSTVTTPSLVSIHFYDRPGAGAESKSAAPGAGGGPQPTQQPKPAQQPNPSQRRSSGGPPSSSNWPSPAFAAATSVIRRLSATQQQQQLHRLHQQVQQHLRARQKSEAIRQQKQLGGGEGHRKSSAPMGTHHWPRLAPKPPLVSLPYMNSAPACLYSASGGGGTLNLASLQPILLPSVHNQQSARKSSVGAIVHLPTDNQAVSSTSINAKALCELLAKAPVIPLTEMQQQPSPEPPSPQLDVLRLISEACDIRHQDSTTPMARDEEGEHKENADVNTTTKDNQEEPDDEKPKRRSSSRLARRPSMDTASQPPLTRKLPRRQSKLESSSPSHPNQQDPQPQEPCSPRQISKQQSRFFYTSGAPMRRILPKPPVMAKSPFILRNPSLK